MPGHKSLKHYAGKHARKEPPPPDYDVLLYRAEKERRADFYAAEVKSTEHAIERAREMMGELAPTPGRKRQP